MAHCGNEPLPIIIIPIRVDGDYLLFFQLKGVFYTIDLIEERLVYLHTLLDGITTVNHRRLVTISY